MISWLNYRNEYTIVMGTNLQLQGGSCEHPGTTVEREAPGIPLSLWRQRLPSVSLETEREWLLPGEWLNPESGCTLPITEPSCVVGAWVALLLGLPELAAPVQMPDPRCSTHGSVTHQPGTTARTCRAFTAPTPPAVPRAPAAPELLADACSPAPSLLKLTKLATPVEMPRLQCNAHPQPCLRRDIRSTRALRPRSCLTTAVACFRANPFVVRDASRPRAALELVADALGAGLGLVVPIPAIPRHALHGRLLGGGGVVVLEQRGQVLDVLAVNDAARRHLHSSARTLLLTLLL